MASHTNPDPEYIGTTEVCRIFDAHPATVSRWVAAGRLDAAYKLPGKNGAYVFRRAVVDKFMAERAAEQSA